MCLLRGTDWCLCMFQVGRRISVGSCMSLVGKVRLLIITLFCPVGKILICIFRRDATYCFSGR